MSGANAEEFSAFMAGRWSALVRFGYGLTGDLGAAEDLARDALATAYATWSRVRRSPDPESQVRKIMVSRMRRSRRPGLWEVAEARPDAPVGAAAVARSGAQDHDRQPLARVDRAFVAGPAGHRELIAALARMPVRQRAVLVLRHVFGLSVTETALSLGWPAGSVRRLEARGAARLGEQSVAAGQSGDRGRDGDDPASLLRAAVMAAQPSPPPVAAALRRGAAIRRTWRAVAAGITVLAAAVALVSVFPARVSRHHHQQPIHVQPVMADRAVAIAAGSEHGLSWELVANSASGTLCARVESVTRTCLNLRSYEYLTGLASISGLAVPLAGSEPAVGPPQWNAIVGVVRSDVSSVRVTMSDGRTLRLRPVRAGGYRWVGLVYWPAAAQVVRASAYQGSSELGTVLPFPGTQTMPGTYFLSLQRQGQKGPPEQERMIDSGGAGRQAWSTSILAGPWGYCALQQLPIVHGARQACWSVRAIGSDPRVLMSTAAPGTRRSWIVGTARPQVAYLMLAMASGHRIKIPVIDVSGERFYALRLGGNEPVTGWAAYNGAGHRLYGGPGTP